MMGTPSRRNCFTRFTADDGDGEQQQENFFEGSIRSPSSPHTAMQVPGRIDGMPSRWNRSTRLTAEDVEIEQDQDLPEDFFFERSNTRSPSSPGSTDFQVDYVDGEVDGQLCTTTSTVPYDGLMMAESNLVSGTPVESTSEPILQQSSKLAETPSSVTLSCDPSPATVSACASVSLSEQQLFLTGVLESESNNF